MTHSAPGLHRGEFRSALIVDDHPVVAEGWEWIIRCFATRSA